jgi:acyl-CoA dehydrogenase
MARRFDEEHEAFRESVRTLLERDPAGGSLFGGAREHGFLGVRVPEEYGGGGADDPRFAVVAVEELMRAGLTGLALAFVGHVGVAVPALLAGASDADRQRWVPGLADGQLRVAVLSASARLTNTGAGLRLAGSQADVVNAGTADVLLVPTLDDDGDRGMAVVAAHAEGVSVKSGADLLGVPGADVADVHIDAVEVGQDDLLDSTAATLADIDTRLWLAVVGVAGGRAVLHWTVDYVRTRTVFGRTVAEFENTRVALGDVLADLNLTESFVDTCLSARQAGTITEDQAAAAKLRCTEFFGRAADQGLQLHGGYGYMREYPISQAFADARFLRLYGGSSESMKLIMATRLGL